MAKVGDKFKLNWKYLRESAATGDNILRWQYWEKIVAHKFNQELPMIFTVDQVPAPNTIHANGYAFNPEYCDFHLTTVTSLDEYM